MGTTGYAGLPRSVDRDELHRHYGGEILLTDFDTNGAKHPKYHCLDYHAMRVAYDMWRERALLAKRKQDEQTKKDRSCADIENDSS